MKKYFYSSGTNSFGPFTLDELKIKGITSETLIWFQGLEDWKKAGTIPELDEFFKPVNHGSMHQEEAGNYEIRTDRHRKTYDILIFLALIFWMITQITSFVLSRTVRYFYYSDLAYIQIVSNLIISFVPLLVALSIKPKTLKIIAIILAVIIFSIILTSSIGWIEMISQNRNSLFQ